MAGDPVPQLPPIGSPASNHVVYKDESASPMVGKRLLFSQASRLHLQVDPDSPMTSRSSSPHTIRNKFVSRNIRKTASCSPLSIEGEISSLISPSIQRRRLIGLKDMYKSQSTHTLDIAPEVLKEAHADLGEKSRSTPGLATCDDVRASALIEKQNTTRSCRKNTTPRRSSTRNKLIATNTTNCTADLSENLSKTCHKSQASKTASNLCIERTNIDQGGRYDEKSEDDSHDAYNGDGMKQVYDKCSNWLQGVENAKRSNNLQVVMESPVTWNE